MSIARWEFEHARRFPEQVGLIFGERAWTNGELHICARRFAAALVDLGVRPGDRIAISLGHSPELFIAWSGAIIAGATLVVLEGRLSQELLDKIEHCDPKVIVCGAQLCASLGPFVPSAAVVVVGDSSSAHHTDYQYSRFDDQVSSHEPLEQFVEVADDTLVQLCYTSGSTGKPKAVCYTQSGLKRLVESLTQKVPDWDPLTTLVCTPPAAFASRLFTIRVLGNHKYVVLSRFEPEDTLVAIERYGVQHIALLPTMAEQLLACGTRKRFDCSTLRSVSISGADVPAALVAGLRKLVAPDDLRASRLRVSVRYGMTEAGGGIAMTAQGGGDGLVGRLVPGAVARICREDGTDADPGEIGQVVVKTPYGPERYWRDPEQTARVFRNGFVYTGDLGYFREDGQLFLAGRSKDVIIQGGVNVYPAELKKVLCAFPGIYECAVVGCASQVLGEEVVVCVVRAEGADLTESQLRRHCRVALDAGKQPVRIVFVDELPKKEGGKVDLEALRQAVSTPTALMGALEAELSLSEATELIERELGRVLFDGLHPERTPQLDPGVPFGELGLTSLGAVRFAHALQERLAWEISPTLAYSHPTIESLAKWLSEQPCS